MVLSSHFTQYMYSFLPHSRVASQTSSLLGGNARFGKKPDAEMSSDIVSPVWGGGTKKTNRVYSGVGGRGGGTVYGQFSFGFGGGGEGLGLAQPTSVHMDVC